MPHKEKLLTVEGLQTFLSIEDAKHNADIILHFGEFKDTLIYLQTPKGLVHCTVEHDLTLGIVLIPINKPT